MKKLLLALLVLGATNAFAIREYEFTPLQSAVQDADINEVSRLAAEANKSDIKYAIREADSRLSLIDANKPENRELREKWNQIKQILEQYK